MTRAADIAPPGPPIRSGLGGEARALLSLGLPLAGSLVAQMLINVTDTLMLGWYDITALAGQTVAVGLFFTFVIFGSGFGWAVMPLVASAAATGETAQVRRVTRMGLWLSLGFAALATPVMVWSGPIFLALGQTPAVAEEAGAYLSIAGLGLAPALVATVLKSYLSALERTRVQLAITLASAGMNIVLNAALIFGLWGFPELGVRGAAISSVTVQTAAALALAVWAAWKTPEHDLFRNPHRPDAEALASVFRLGLPIALTHLAEIVLFAGSSVMMGWIGALQLAAHGIALQIASVTFMVHFGLSQAITVRVGQAWGQGQAARVRTASLAAVLLSGGMVLLTMIAFLAIPKTLIGLFTDPADPARPQLLAAGATFLAIAALFQAADAAQTVGLGMLRGVQDTRVPMILASVGYWVVGFPAAWALGFPAGLGGAGIWLGLTAGLAVVGGSVQFRFWRRVTVSPRWSSASP